MRTRDKERERERARARVRARSRARERERQHTYIYANTQAMQPKSVEHLLMLAAAVILSSEALSTRCMTEMSELQVYVCVCVSVSE